MSGCHKAVGLKLFTLNLLAYFDHIFCHLLFPQHGFLDVFGVLFFFLQLDFRILDVYSIEDFLENLIKLDVAFELLENAHVLAVSHTFIFVLYSSLLDQLMAKLFVQI